MGLSWGMIGSYFERKTVYGKLSLMVKPPEAIFARIFSLAYVLCFDFRTSD